MKPNSSIAPTAAANINATYDINALNNMLIKAGAKPITANMIKSLTPDQVTQLLAAQKQGMKQLVHFVKKMGWQVRRNAAAMGSENYKLAKLTHNTIRQAIAEAGGLATQGITGGLINEAKKIDAISQNTSGGTQENPGGSGNDEDDLTNTEHGPVRYSRPGRRER